MRVLVTGCSGYIGSVLVKKLLQLPQYYVHGVDNHTYKQDYVLLNQIGHPQFDFDFYDVQDIQNVAKKEYDVVVWLAALVGAPICDKFDKETVYDINGRSLPKFLSSLDYAPKVIYLNTNSGYGTTPPGVKATETSPQNPLSSYAQSKQTAEDFLVAAYPDFVSLRLATVFGLSPRMRFDLLVNTMVAELSLTNRVKVISPDARRNYVHIEDVCRAIIWAMAPRVKGIYNVGLDEANMTKLELANTIVQVCGQGVVEVIEGEDPDKRDYNISSEKIRTAGFKFTHSLESGIFDVYRFCQSIHSPTEFIKRSRNDYNQNP